MFYNILEKIQSHIMINYGNKAYQKISNDNYFEHIPSELYEIWYSSNRFSFRKFKYLKDIPSLKGKALLRYYINIVIIFIKIIIIFKKIERRN